MSIETFISDISNVTQTDK